MCARRTSTRASASPARAFCPLSRLERSAVPHEPGKALVLQCNSGNRSAKAGARPALPKGTRLYHLAGGIQAWKRAGLPVESGASERPAAAA
jgi:rhodanese-related sulfurtransferase